MGMKCFLCEKEGRTNVLFKTIREYSGHIQLFHAHQRNFTIDCGIRGCRRSFSKFHTFRKHVSDWHSGDPDPTNYEDGTEVCQDCLNQTSPDDVQEASHDAKRKFQKKVTQAYWTVTQIFRHQAMVTWQKVGNQLTAVIAHLYYQSYKSHLLYCIKEENKLPQTVLQQIIDGVTSLNQTLLGLLEREVHHCIRNTGISVNSIPNLVNSEGHFGRPFVGLETQHLQLSFYKKHFKIVVSYLHVCQCCVLFMVKCTE